MEIELDNIPRKTKGSSEKTKLAWMTNIMQEIILKCRQILRIVLIYPQPKYAKSLINYLMNKTNLLIKPL